MKKFLTDWRYAVLVFILIAMFFVVSAHAWEGDITLGGTLQSGNTDKTSISLGAKATQRTGDERYSGQVLYNYAEEDDELSARNIYGTLKYDRFIVEQIYGYLSVELQKDKLFKNLNLRTIIGPGVGFQIWDTKGRSLSVEGGISYFSEDIEIGEDKQWLTARLGSNFRQKVSESIAFFDSLVVNPSVENFGEYILRNEASLNSVLSENWSIKLSNVLQYDSEAIDVHKTDSSWTLGLQYNF